MANKNIILSKSAINKQKGVVVLSLAKWQKMEKEMMEIKDAMEAILEGELDLKKGRTKSFKDFIKEDFPQYAKNK